MDSGNRFACFFINHAACGFVGLPGASESDVDVRDLAPFFDFDDPGLFLVGRVGMICKPELWAPAPSFASRADDVAPRRQPVDAVNAAVIRYGRLVYEIFVGLL